MLYFFLSRFVRSVGYQPIPFLETQSIVPVPLLHPMGKQSNSLPLQLSTYLLDVFRSAIFLTESKDRVPSLFPVGVRRFALSRLLHFVNDSVRVHPLGGVIRRETVRVADWSEARHFVGFKVDNS